MVDVGEGRGRGGGEAGEGSGMERWRGSSRERWRPVGSSKEWWGAVGSGGEWEWWGAMRSDGAEWGGVGWERKEEGGEVRYGTKTTLIEVQRNKTKKTSPLTRKNVIFVCPLQKRPQTSPHLAVSLANQ